MKSYGLFIVSVLAFSLYGYSQEKQTTSGTESQTNASTAIAIPGGLSAKEISELKTEWTDEKKGKKYLFTASFSQRKPTEPAEKKKYQKSGEIPLRITATLYEVKAVNGKPMYMRQGGSVKFAVIASDKKVLLSKSASLDKMCPSWGGVGGYFGEVAKEGQYTLVIWTKFNDKVNFGKVLTAEFTKIQ